MRIGIIPADIMQPCRVEEVESLELEKLQELVGGYVEVVNTRDVPGIQPPMSIWLNEEGKITEPPLEVNRLATVVARVGTGIFPADRIHGDVVIAGGTDGDGNSLGMDERTDHWFGHMIEIREHIRRAEQDAIRAMTAALS